MSLKWILVLVVVVAAVLVAALTIKQPAIEISGVVDEESRGKLSARFTDVEIRDVRIDESTGAHNVAVVGKASESSMALYGVKDIDKITAIDIVDNSAGLQGVTTDVAVVDDVTLDYAVIRLKNYGPVDAIARCDNYDAAAETCGQWIRTDIPFAYKGDYVEFTVTHFTGFGGISLGNRTLYVRSSSSFASDATATPSLRTLQDGTQNSVTFTLASGVLYNIMNASLKFSEGMTIRADRVVNFSSYWNDGSGIDSAFATFKLFYSPPGSNDMVLVCKDGDDGTGGKQIPDGAAALVKGNCTPSSDVTIPQGSKLTYVVNVFASSISGSPPTKTATLAWDTSTADTWVRFEPEATADITVATNQTEYQGGQTVNVTGRFFWVNESNVVNRNVTVEFYNPSGGLANKTTVLTDGVLNSLSNATYTEFTFTASGSPPRDIAFSGTNFYVVGSGTDTVYEYDINGVATGFSFSVASQETTATGIAFNGTRFYVTGVDKDRVFEYTSAGVYTGFNFSTAGQATTPNAVAFNGTHFHVLDDATDKVYEYNLTGSYTGSSFSTTPDTAPVGLAFDGTYFYVVGGSGDTVYEYNRTGGYTGFNFNYSVQETQPTGGTFTGTYFYIVGFNGGIFEYGATRKNTTNYRANFTLPGGAEAGTWTVNVTGNYSGSVYATNSTTFNVSGVAFGYLNASISLPANNTGVTQNSTFTINATVTCAGAVGAVCGNVSALARYNASSAVPDTKINTTQGAKPLFVTETNPKNSSETLEAGEGFNFTWTVNVTGDIGSTYFVDVLFNSTTYPSNVPSNNTGDRKIEIVSVVVKPSVTDVKATPNPGANGTFINVAAEITAPSGISSAAARVSFPNGTVWQNITMAQSGNIWSANFTARFEPSGNYTIRINATDNGGGVNDTESIQFVPYLAFNRSEFIIIDGSFDDWTNVMNITDPAGEGFDIKTVSVANDDSSLFSRLITDTINFSAKYRLYLSTELNAGNSTTPEGASLPFGYEYRAEIDVNGTCVLYNSANKLVTETSAGPNNPSVSENIDTGGKAWDGPGSVASSDNSYAEVTLLANVAYTGFNFNVSVQDTTPTGLAFNGTNFYVVGVTNKRVYEYNRTGNYTGFNFSVANQDNSTNDLALNGTRFYTVGFNSKNVFEYNLTGNFTGFNFSVGSQEFNPNGITFNGTHFYMVGQVADTVYEYNRTGKLTGFNFSVKKQDELAAGIDFDNSHFYVVGDSNDSVYEYNRTGNFTGFNFSVASQDTSPRGVAFNGTHFHVVGADTDSVYGYKLGNDTSDGLRARNFSLNVPSDATINGIKIEVERKASGSFVRDGSVRLVKGGSIVGNNKADTGSDWPTTDAVKTYGSSTDLWGTTWTPADINSADFGAQLEAALVAGTIRNASVDNMKISVYYATTDACTFANSTSQVEMSVPLSTIGASFNDEIDVAWETVNQTIRSDIFPELASFVRYKIIEKGVVVTFLIETNISGTAGDTAFVDDKNATGLYTAKDVSKFFACLQDSSLADSPALGIAFAGEGLNYIKLEAGNSFVLRLSQQRQGNKFIIPVVTGNCSVIRNRLPAPVTTPFGSVSDLFNAVELFISYPVDLVGDFERTGPFTLLLEKNETGIVGRPR